MARFHLPQACAPRRRGRQRGPGQTLPEPKEDACASGEAGEAFRSAVLPALPLEESIERVNRSGRDSRGRIPYSRKTVSEEQDKVARDLSKHLEDCSGYRKEIREELRGIREDIHQSRELSSTNAIKVIGLEERMDDIRSGQRRSPGCDPRRRIRGHGDDDRYCTFNLEE